jgi:hypothetical protein
LVIDEKVLVTIRKQITKHLPAAFFLHSGTGCFHCPVADLCRGWDGRSTLAREHSSHRHRVTSTGSRAQQPRTTYQVRVHVCRNGMCVDVLASEVLTCGSGQECAAERAVVTYHPGHHRVGRGALGAALKVSVCTWSAMWRGLRGEMCSGVCQCGGGCWVRCVYQFKP